MSIRADQIERPRPSYRHVWSELELAMLRSQYEHVCTSDLAELLRLPVRTVYNKAKELGLRKSPEALARTMREKIASNPYHGGRRTQFRKGDVPPNKGLRRPGYGPGRMALTQFQRGNKPHTWRPVGTMTVDAYGYLKVKVAETECSRLGWIAFHRKVWIEANGPIPRGQVVVFKPGRQSTDPKLITPDALELVTRRELMARNTIHNLPPELAQIILLRGALTRAINERSAQAEKS